MKLSDKVKAVQNELIDALCNIKEMPEGVLPHLVFVEEEARDVSPVYNRYKLLQIIPKNKSCIVFNPRTGQNEEEEFLLSEINIDWLETVWKRYLDCSGITEKDEPQLYVFVWHFEHMERDASDEEILKAWELQEHEEYNVSRYTPDEFAAYINDNMFDDLQYYVRCIKTV